MAIRNVIINGDTTGTIDESSVEFRIDDFIGENVRYTFHDENGNVCESNGNLTDILD